MEIPTLNTDNLLSNPRAKRISSTMNLFSQHNTTKKQDQQILRQLTKPNFNPEGSIPLDKHIENINLERQFNEKWNKKKKNKTLNQALFDISLQRRLEEVEEEQSEENEYEE